MTPAPITLDPLTIWLPKPPDNANGRQHWSVANREKKEFWSELLRRGSTRYHVPRPPRVAIPRARYDVYWVAERKNWMPDRDNAIRRLKPALDWLVANDYLEEDDPEHLELGAIDITHRKAAVESPPNLCTVRLTIVPLAPPNPHPPV